jgi:hypothetical protein
VCACVRASWWSTSSSCRAYGAKSGRHISSSSPASPRARARVSGRGRLACFRACVRAMVIVECAAHDAELAEQRLRAHPRGLLGRADLRARSCDRARVLARTMRVHMRAPARITVCARRAQPLVCARKIRTSRLSLRSASTGAVTKSIESYLHYNVLHRSASDAPQRQRCSAAGRCSAPTARR